MGLNISPSIAQCSDVILTNPVAGDVLVRDANDRWVNQPAASLVPPVSVLQSAVGPVAAGGFVDALFAVPGTVVVLSASVSLLPAPLTLTTLWEIAWVRGGSGASGKFLGPGVTTVTNSVPAVPAAGQVVFRVINRSGVANSYQLFFTVA